MNDKIISRLKSDITLIDGAMGTMLYSKGVYINTCFDDLNLTRPNLVTEIHEEYLKAGAEIIETNTFGANRFKLSAYGIEDRVKQINQAGAELARKAAGKSAMIAGSIGPLGKPLRPLGIISEDDARSAFSEQAGALSELIDLFIIETMPSLEEMKVAIAAVRSLSKKPIIAQMTFTDEGETPLGESPENVAKELSELPVEFIGCNCSIGPQPMLEVVERLRASTTKPLSAQPNAGAPRMVENRFIYLTSPEYMAEYAKRFIQSGVSLIGGCCGTTPDHIKAIRSAIKALQPMYMEARGRTEEGEEVKKLQEVDFDKRSRLSSSLGHRFVISVEIDPPKGLSPDRSLENAKLMKEHEVDAINIADGPRASARMSPMALAALMQTRIGIETILHYCCRDRNLLGMQSDLIGAHAMGLRNLLIITGDPPKLGDYPDATAVYDVDSIGLVRIVKNMNQGQDLAGNPLGAVTSFVIGVGVNPGALDIEKEVGRFYKKVESGAEYALTQPVYEPRLLEDFLDLTRDITIPILVGILPLSSFKNAEFLHNEVPGMQIPSSVREMMRKAPTGDKARDTGIRIAQEALKGCMSLDKVSGAYVMPPLGRFDSLIKIIQTVRSS